MHPIRIFKRLKSLASDEHETSRFYLSMALRVMIIDADHLSVKLSRVLLELEGWEVIHAASNDHARALIVSERPDLIVTALGLPEEALDLMRELKRLHREVRIVVVTSLDGWEARAVAAGCSGFIQKPICVDTFSRQLHRYLGGSDDTNPACR
jgi:DNA-binding NarL/FixJ family response regulator